VADSTHPILHRSHSRARRCVAVSVALLALASGWAAAPAQADGDPASDVLALQTLFLPQDAGVPLDQQGQLVALLAAARHDGYQLRVALIASATDLGSVTELWRQPQSYAQFLGQELSLVYRGPVLVGMPNGFGLYRPGRPLSAEQTALAGVPAPAATAGGLATAALETIRRLAAASGHVLEIPRTTAASAATSGSADEVSWLAFAIGVTLIAAAWTASLRAQPAHRRDRRVSAS
jgi:hypothetical protein